MRLDTIIVGDAAAQAGGKLSILGVWTTRLTPAQYPWTEPSISIVVRAWLDEEDFGADHTLEVAWDGPDGTRVGFPSRFDVPRAFLDSARGQSIQGEQLAVAFTATFMGASFPQPGPYAVVVSIDGTERGRYHIVAAEPPAPSS